jgi:hypothetical protein
LSPSLKSIETFVPAGAEARFAGKPFSTKELRMPNEKEQVRIQLTPEQKALVKNVTGKDAEVVELSVTELEERIAPMMYQ